MCVKEEGSKQVLQEPRCEGRQGDSSEDIFYTSISLRRQFLNCRM